MNFDDYLKEVIEKDKDFEYSFEIENIKNNLIKQVLTYRKENNLTQKALAELIGVKQQVISRFENGNCNVGLDFLAKLAHIMGELTLKNKNYSKYSSKILEKNLNEIPIGRHKKHKISVRVYTGDIRC